MSAVRTAAGALLRSRDRATSVLTVAAFALPHAFLLAVTGGVMAFGARAAVAATSATADDPSSLDGMASFYVMLAYFAATLLVVPIISMGAAAARLGVVRSAVASVAASVGLAPEVVLAPQVQRYLAWAPLDPSRPSGDEVEERMVNRGARDWQIDLTLDPICDALGV